MTKSVKISGVFLGSVTELIARWLTKNWLPVDVLFENKPVDDDADVEADDDDDAEADVNEDLDTSEVAVEADKPALESSKEIAHNMSIPLI